MSEIQTVRIKYEGGFAIINQSDYDSKKHELVPDLYHEIVPFSGEDLDDAELYLVRKNELELMGWVDIKDICTRYEIEKTKDLTYHELIPQILSIEFGEGYGDN
jgi:hypothetical protein